MAQHDYNLANQSGAALRADLNDALAAIVSNNSGATEPATTFAYQLWADTTAAVLKQRNAANNAWVTLFKLADGSLPSVQTQLATRFAAGGTADAITGTLSPAIASYTAGLRVTATPGGANTVTGPTLNLNSLGAKTIKKRDASGSKVALVAGDYNASGPFDFEYDSTDFVLLNPVANVAVLGIAQAFTAKQSFSAGAEVTGAAGLGYGTGAGGTVTQSTSKSTAVTLNKPTGQITMHNASLGAGASVIFALNNSLITAVDILVLNATSFGNYSVVCVNTSTGAASIRVTNISGGALAEALYIQFAIIKGAAA